MKSSLESKKISSIEVEKYLDTKYILVLTGVRRCGKSYLLFQILEFLLKKTPPENVLYVNFDDPVFVRLRTNVKDGIHIEQLIQVCWDMKEVKTKEREVKALAEAMESLKLPEGIVVTDDLFGEDEIEGKRIRFIPLWCWLLREG